MAEKYRGPLSKTLPGQVVTVPEGSEYKGYYKYFKETFVDITKEEKDALAAAVHKKGEGIEIEDRSRIFDLDVLNGKDGYYPLKGGGVLSAAFTKVPGMTGEQLAWWASWHGVEPLRYAIWDPQDHYDIQIVENRDRLFDESIPFGERVWGTHHKIWESFDQDKPARIEMEFFNPYETGMNPEYRGTDRDMYTICAQGHVDGAPSFAVETLCMGIDGVAEIRSFFWVGYEMQEDGSIKYKLPFFIKPPVKVVAGLMTHNHREFTHLNKVLPALYEEYKDKPFDAD